MLQEKCIASRWQVSIQWWISQQIECQHTNGVTVYVGICVARIILRCLFSYRDMEHILYLVCFDLQPKDRSVFLSREKLFDWTLDLTCQWITLLASSFSTGKLVRAMSALVSCCDTVPAHTSPAQCGRYCESGSTCFCSRSARASCQVTSLPSWWQQTQQQQRRHPSPGPPHLPPAACCPIAPAEDPEVRPPGCSSLTGLLIRQMSPSIHFVCVKSTEDCVCIMEQSHFTSILRTFLPCPIRLNLSLPCVSWCGANSGLVVWFFCSTLSSKFKGSANRNTDLLCLEISCTVHNFYFIFHFFWSIFILQVLQFTNIDDNPKILKMIDIVLKVHI